MGDLPDPRRTIGTMLQLGTVDSVDLAAATCRVRAGEIVTGDVPWIAARAGRVRIWSPPSVGEQCLLICPEGDLEAAVALPGLFSDANGAADSSPDTVRIDFDDGAVVSYDIAAHALHAMLPGNGTVYVDAPGGITLEGPVTIKGALTVEQDATVNGTLTADTDVVGAGKSLKGHLHKNVQSGSGVSGPPQ